MYDGFTLFGEYTESWKVHLIKNLLEENGIRVILDNSNMASMFSIAAFSERIYVNTEDFEQALKLIEESDISEDIDFDKLDEIAEKAKTETALLQKTKQSEVAKIKKMPVWAIIVFGVNYILLLFQIAARIAVLNETGYIEVFRYFLPLIMLIAIIHIFYFVYIKTSNNLLTSDQKQSLNSSEE